MCCKLRQEAPNITHGHHLYNLSVLSPHDCKVLEISRVSSSKT